MKNSLKKILAWLRRRPKRRPISSVSLGFAYKPEEPPAASVMLAIANSDDENAGKWRSMLKRNPATVFDYDFARLRHSIDVSRSFGHAAKLRTLFWMKPTFFPADAADDLLRRESRIELMTEHISRVGEAFNGQCGYEFESIDVVNEPIAPGYRTPMLKEDRGLVDQVDVEELAGYFKRARLAFGRRARLGVNEWGCEFAGSKQAKLVKLIRELRDHGAPVDYVGLQCHLTTGDATRMSEFLMTVRSFHTEGVAVHITELDITQEIDGDRATQDALQAMVARDVVKVALATGVSVLTCWDWNDRDSWKGASLRATPFDADLKPKPFWRELEPLTR